MTIKKTINFLVLSMLVLLFTVPANAAFPIKNNTQDVTVAETEQAAQPTTSDATGKSQLVALILCLLVGMIGIHRFYLGYTWQGVVQLLTFGGFGIWTLIDLIRIVTGDLKPNGAEYEETI